MSENHLPTHITCGQLDTCRWRPTGIWKWRYSLEGLSTWPWGSLDKTMALVPDLGGHWTKPWLQFPPLVLDLGGHWTKPWLQFPPLVPDLKGHRTKSCLQYPTLRVTRPNPAFSTWAGLELATLVVWLYPILAELATLVVWLYSLLAELATLVVWLYSILAELA